MNSSPWTSRDAAIVAPARRDDVVVHELDDEVILTLADGSTYHLNRTAVSVWRLCDGRRTTREIASDLANFHDVAFEEVLNDVEELILWLAESSLLHDACES
jgi:hypothetical protein